MKTVYQFKPQSRLKGDPQKVGEAIEDIIDRRGTADPEDIVEAARPKKNVLHSYFQWEDSKAAQEYRLQQARHLLRSIVTVKSEGLEITSPMRGFVSVRAAADDAQEDNQDGEPVGSYTTLANAVRIVRYREQMLTGALRDLDAYRMRYQLLADLTGWADALHKARAFLERAIEESQKEPA
jgi:hypothetical protein